MTGLSDPARSQAVLVGVHAYAGLEDLPAVERNLDGLRDALLHRAVWGLPPASCTVVSQPADTGAVLDTIRERAALAEDTLLVYYAGHGLTDPYNDELYLALPGSDLDREYTSLRYEYLRRTVLDLQPRVPRTVVILDCCYSGRALVGGMNAGVDIAERTVISGTCLLTASAETRPALAPPGEMYTAFTGELINTLVNGAPGKPDPLDMHTLYRHLHERLAGRCRPLPQQRNRNTGGQIALARNRAVYGGDPADDGDARLLEQEARRRLAAMEQRTEQLRSEAEQLRREAERRARETVRTAQELANAMAADPEPDFTPFWFAVPVARPLLGQNDSLTPVAQLEPGIWYLAVERRGTALRVQTGEGLRGLLLETGGIERGDVGDGEVAEAVATEIRPFWFAVPVPRPLLDMDDTDSRAGQLEPGVWYLAVAWRGDALVVQDEERRRGLLLETEGIQHGSSGAEKSHVRRVRDRARLLLRAVLAAPEPGFRPYWFAVPSLRRVLSEDGSLTPLGQLEPGVWYLAVERRGDALVVQDGEGVRGLLLETEGIQRG